MRTYCVVFERTVMETATLMVDAESRETAIKQALEILEEPDYERDDTSEPEIVSARPMRKK